MSCGKYITGCYFTIFNILLMLFGVGVLVQGVVQSQLVDQMVIMAIGTPLLFQSTEQILVPVITVGAFVAIIGFIGMLGGIRGNLIMVVMYISLLFISIFVNFGLAFYHGIPNGLDPHPEARQTLLKIGLIITSCQLFSIILGLLFISSRTTGRCAYKFTATA